MVSPDDTMNGILHVIGVHPYIALLVVALVAFAESVAIIGTLVPAAVVMFAAGTLVGKGDLNLWPTLGLATAGAVLGDSLSYEMGRSHEQRLRGWHWFQTHQQAVARGERFIRDHGSASIVLARFMGAVRAFVPLLAGFAKMPRGIFYGFNIGSALLWAPVHILPGVVFGTSLKLAEAVSGRLAFVMLLFVIVCWCATWLARTAVHLFVPVMSRLRHRIVEHARSQVSLVARATLAVLDPARPGASTLLAGGILLFGTGWLFFGVLEDVVSNDPLVQVDVAVYRFLQGLRTVSIDRVMVSITEMGGVGVMLPLVVAVALWLLWRRQRLTAIYWLSSAAVAELLVELLKTTLGRHRPAALYSGVEQFSFPSAHVTLSTVVLGFLAFLVSRGKTSRVRLAIAVFAGIYVGLVAISRLYLGAHWFSDVVGGISLGLAWVALLAMVCTQRGIGADLEPRGVTLTSAFTIVVCGVVSVSLQAPADIVFYAAKETTRSVTEQAWLANGWRALPRRRQEFAGDTEEPFELQWACAGDAIQRTLSSTGWIPAPDWSARVALAALAPGTTLEDLPVLPRFDRGLPSGMMFVHSSTQGPARRDVLRLWRSEFRMQEPSGSNRPIWYGALYAERRPDGGLFSRELIRQAIEPGNALTPLLPSDVPVARRSRKPGEPDTSLLRCPSGSATLVSLVSLVSLVQVASGGETPASDDVQ
jgi:membrane protein DedA with SNARE-associated domain/membrane-associated phospholipid phosphatase